MPLLEPEMMVYDVIVKPHRRLATLGIKIGTCHCVRDSDLLDSEWPSVRDIVVAMLADEIAIHVHAELTVQPAGIDIGHMLPLIRRVKTERPLPLALFPSRCTAHTAYVAVVVAEAEARAVVPTHAVPAHHRAAILRDKRVGIIDPGRHRERLVLIESIADSKVTGQCLILHLDMGDLRNVELHCLPPLDHFDNRRHVQRLEPATQLTVVLPILHLAERQIINLQVDQLVVIAVFDLVVGHRFRKRRHSVQHVAEVRRRAVEQRNLHQVTPRILDVSPVRRDVIERPVVVDPHLVSPVPPLALHRRRRPDLHRLALQRRCSALASAVRRRDRKKNGGERQRDSGPTDLPANSHEHSDSSLQVRLKHTSVPLHATRGAVPSIYGTFPTSGKLKPTNQGFIEAQSNPIWDPLRWRIGTI